MAVPDAGDPGEDLEALIDQLGDGETRDLLLELASRHGDAARAVRLAAAQPSGRVPLLRTALDELQTRGFLGYRESMAWARDAEPVIDEISDEAERSPSREILKLVELALNRMTKLIGRADDSAGTIGDLVGQLLETHAQICDTGLADPKTLAKWMIRFSDGQGFFVIDPVRYSKALGEQGVDSLRQAVEARSESGDPTFAVRYTEERLAVLEGDLDRIVSLLGGDLSAPHQFTRIAEAMLELGRGDDALAWATRGIESTSGWQVRRLYDIAADVLDERGDTTGALELRRRHHRQSPSSTTYAALKHAASAVNAWDREQGAARDVLAARDVGGLVDALLAEHDDDAAWEAAVRASADLGETRWGALAEAREPTHPAEAFEVYVRLVDATLLTTDRRAYRKAAKLLKAERRAATTAGRRAEFDAHVAAIRDRYRRRPTLIAILDKAGLG